MSLKYEPSSEPLHIFLTLKPIPYTLHPRTYTLTPNPNPQPPNRQHSRPPLLGIHPRVKTRWSSYTGLYPGHSTQGCIPRPLAKYLACGSALSAAVTDNEIYQQKCILTLPPRCSMLGARVTDFACGSAFSAAVTDGGEVSPLTPTPITF